MQQIVFELLLYEIHFVDKQSVSEYKLDYERRYKEISGNKGSVFT